MKLDKVLALLSLATVSGVTTSLVYRELALPQSSYEVIYYPVEEPRVKLPEKWSGEFTTTVDGTVVKTVAREFVPRCAAETMHRALCFTVQYFLRIAPTYRPRYVLMELRYIPPPAASRWAEVTVDHFKLEANPWHPACTSGPVHDTVYAFGRIEWSRFGIRNVHNMLHHILDFCVCIGVTPVLVARFCGLPVIGVLGTRAYLPEHGGWRWRVGYFEEPENEDFWSWLAARDWLGKYMFNRSFVLELDREAGKYPSFDMWTFLARIGLRNLALRHLPCLTLSYLYAFKKSGRLPRSRPPIRVETDSNHALNIVMYSDVNVRFSVEDVHAVTVEEIGGGKVRVVVWRGGAPKGWFGLCLYPPFHGTELDVRPDPSYVPVKVDEFVV